GISRPTAAKALAALESAGLVTRTPGGRDGSKRLPDQWQPVTDPEGGASGDEETHALEPEGTADSVSAAVTRDEEPEPDEREPADGVETPNVASAEKPATTTTKSSTARLGSGQLRDMVLQLLRDHPNEDFTPSAIGKRLDRSSGAVSNACDRLQMDGAVVQSNDKPRKFRLASAK